MDDNHDNVDDVDEKIKRNFFENRSNLKDACRVCFSRLESPSKSPCSPSEAELIWICSGVRLAPEDALCKGCSDDLRVVRSFRLRCQRSDRLLADPVDPLDRIKIERDSDPDDSDLSDRSDILVECEVTLETFEGNKICHICDSPFDSKSSLECHLMEEHDEPKKPPVKKQKAQKKKRNCERKFSCPECPYSAPRRRDLVYHVRTHTGERPFKCDRCDAAFAQPGTLTAHRAVHDERRLYPCEQCGKRFKHKNLRRRHRLVHSAAAFVCDICKKGLKTKGTLLDHLNRHYNVKNFSCETCGLSFVTPSELFHHAKIHGGEKRFACDLCDFRTRQKRALEVHVMRHYGDRPFKCPRCPRTFYTEADLKRHATVHAEEKGEKSHACPVCDARFGHRASVNKHILSLHDGINIVQKKTVI